VIRAGIVGATGYGGRELLRLLGAHGGVKLSALASTSVSGETLDDALPAFRKMHDLSFESFDAQALAAKCDVVFVGVPGKLSMAPVAALRAAGARVIDIGADFRLKDTAAYTRYYNAEHTAAQLLPEAVYGHVPWYREELRGASLVAVPGCYPISILTPVRPLLDAPLMPCLPIVVDSISGISGAGRSTSEAFHFPEMNENLKAYKIGNHQHVPEIEQELGFRALVQFTPHVAPITRGILTTITLRPERAFDPAPYFARYEAEPFVRVLGPGVLPEVKHVRGSNFCDFGWVMDQRTGNLVIVSAIDNLVGGTAGMALQCMNLMFGLDETEGLRYGGMAP
jgi:N-acetyl-gamma-glutamyl-phosphate reductase